MTAPAPWMPRGPDDHANISNETGPPARGRCRHRRGVGRPRVRAALRCAGVALLALVLGACVGATDGARAPAEVPDDAAPAAGAPTERAPSDGATTDTAPSCVHGCVRWGESCNVDPRGVYKCQRRCERFGEICE